MVQLVYVNPDNGTSGDGTTAETDSSADSAWKTLGEAIADLPATFTEDIEIHCAGVADDTTSVDFDGYAVGAFSLTVIGDYSGYGWNAGEYVLSSSNANGTLQISTDVILKNLQVESIGSGASRRSIKVNTLAATEFVQGHNLMSRVVGTVGTTSNAILINVPTVVYQSIWINCQFVNRLDTAVFVSDLADGCVMYNCLAYGSTFDDGFVAIGGDSIVLKNCLAAGNFDKDYAGGTANSKCITNLSEDTTAFGTSPVTSATITFEDTANYDFRLVVGDTDAIGAATDLSTDADSLFSFSTDAAGNTRSSWDIGPHEYQSSISAAITGTATASIVEADIVTGGKTIIITLTGDTWIAAGTGPIGTIAQSDALLASIDSAQAEAAGWDAEVKANFVTGDLVRTSNTVATITLGAEAAYAITAQETISIGDIANAILTTSGTDLAVTGSFTIDPDSTAVTITDVDTDETLVNNQLNVVTTGTNFEAAQGTGVMRLTDGSITSNFTIDSWSDVSVQGDLVQGNVPFTTASHAVAVEIINDSASSDMLAVTFDPEADTAVVELASPVETDGHIAITGTPVTGDQYHYDSILYESDGVTPTVFTVSVSATGFITTGGSPTPGATFKFKARHWDQTNWDESSLSTGAVQTVIIPVADVTAPNLSLPTSASITESAVVIGATTDEANGTAYGIITANGNQTLPTNQEVIDGTAPEELFGAVDLTISATGVFTFASIPGLTPNTTYGYAIVHEDISGNEDAGSRVNGTFTTDTADVTAPTLDSITINDASPNDVVMRFSEPVTGTNLGFTLAGTTSTTFASISGSGTTWTGVLASPATELETITLSYASVTGDFEDLSANALADITNQAVVYRLSSGLKLPSVRTPFRLPFRTTFRTAFKG